MEQRVIDRYEATYFPSSDGRSARSLTAPAILAIRPIKKKSQQRFAGLSSFLIQSRSQEELSSRSGLAPANAQCQAPDRQASDVRLWAAASQEPLPDLYHVLYKTANERETFAQALRSRLEFFEE